MCMLIHSAVFLSFTSQPSLSLSMFPPPLPPALLLGNPLYDLLLLTSCHMTSSWLRGKSWKVWLQTFKHLSDTVDRTERRGRLIFWIAFWFLCMYSIFYSLLSTIYCMFFCCWCVFGVYRNIKFLTDCNLLNLGSKLNSYEGWSHKNEITKTQFQLYARIYGYSFTREQKLILKITE